MRLRKSILSIGKTPCTVVKLSYNLPKDKLIQTHKIHFIQLLDRSSSMNAKMDELIENLKKTIGLMDNDDLLSIVWFAGHGECGTLIKGVSPSDPELFKLLDTIKSTHGATCFSEALQETEAVANELYSICDNVVISLFTDGEPDVPWSKKEEEAKCLKVMSRLGTKILAFNTIGYGTQYNSDLLKRLSSFSRYGRHTHSTKINEYLTHTIQSYKSLKYFTPEKLEINSSGQRILYINRSISRISDNLLQINLSAKAQNKIYLINSSDEEFSFSVNGRKIDSSNIKLSLDDNETKQLLHYLAYEEYYIGNSSVALGIIKHSLKDKFLSKSILNSFTRSERQNCCNNLLKAARNRKLKISPKTWVKARLAEGELGDDRSIEYGPCLIELLQLFAQNNDKFIPLPGEEYRRIGKKVADNFNMFKKDKNSRVLGDFNDLVFNKERLNLSIRYRIPGYVTINPRQAKASGLLSNIISASIYREQTIIKDGELNIRSFKLLASKETLTYLGKLNIHNLFTIIEDERYTFEDYTLIIVNTYSLPVITEKLTSIGDSLEGILNIFSSQREAECRQKVIKHFLTKCDATQKGKKYPYTSTQLSLLKDYGLTPDGIYQGIDNKVLSGGDDTYEYRFFEFALKGFSTLPSVENLIRKLNEGTEEFNGPEAVMAECIKYIIENRIDSSINKLNALLKKQKMIISSCSKVLSIIRLSRTLTGGWWKGLTTDSRGNYIYEKDDRTLVIKVMKKQAAI